MTSNDDRELSATLDTDTDTSIDGETDMSIDDETSSTTTVDALPELHIRIKNMLLPLKILAPTLYALVRIGFVHSSLELLDYSFFIPLLLIFLLATITDCTRSRADQARKAHASQFKQYTIMLGEAGTALQASNEAIVELRQGQEMCQRSWEEATSELKQVYEKLNQSQRQRIKEYDELRRNTNDMQIVSYQARYEHQQLLIDTLTKLVKKFKNVPVPKVKGVSPSKANTNTLTGPLERLAMVLRRAQHTTEKRVAVAEKIKAVLEREELSTPEINELIGDAEKDLKDAPSTPLQQAPLDGSGLSTTTDSVTDDAFEVKLDAHFERLDAFLQSVATKSGEEEDKGDDTHGAGYGEVSSTLE
ncbi:uncharacterized protein K460DRAFT_400303 [Cucurbitaria berberidis CBS 394.84]|uniref:Uncharacterized protein n=1 Tax=Cucurbitaria berberidis CBS 394.84 TaxID=1168544 RepID=A0A9P4LDL9_9PLEO|nr:uncharacterized protein K460DRAFT_400303 [Cucurbitaria berberidis CBS 394.84]KAF1850234.1 hypothetical protein K460DRAFT_400303 [Cucurbitaria berberidis CBS 394.84]